MIRAYIADVMPIERSALRFMLWNRNMEIAGEAEDWSASILNASKHRITILNGRRLFFVCALILISFSSIALGEQLDADLSLLENRTTIWIIEPLALASSLLGWESQVLGLILIFTLLRAHIGEKRPSRLIKLNSSISNIRFSRRPTL